MYTVITVGFSPANAVRSFSCDNLTATNSVSLCASCKLNCDTLDCKFYIIIVTYTIIINNPDVTYIYS